MIGNEEMNKVEDLLAVAMGSLTEAQKILFPHNPDQEAEGCLRNVKRAINAVTWAMEELELPEEQVKP